MAIKLPAAPYSKETDVLFKQHQAITSMSHANAIPAPEYASSDQ